MERRNHLGLMVKIEREDFETGSVSAPKQWLNLEVGANLDSCETGRE